MALAKQPNVSALLTRRVKCHLTSEVLRVSWYLPGGPAPPRGRSPRARDEAASGGFLPFAGLA
jgi:hypothetical protein